MRGAAKIDRTQKCGITLPIILVKQVDRVRGDIPRSTYIRRAVEQYMNGKSGGSK
jgi:metal-responsive CopG/Arc/MetJ family transcriptional regulator